MTIRFLEKIPIIILSAALIPAIAAYCLLWAVMTLGGGFVKRFVKKII